MILLHFPQLFLLLSEARREPDNDREIDSSGPALRMTVFKERHLRKHCAYILNPTIKVVLFKEYKKALKGVAKT